MNLSYSFHLSNDKNKKNSSRKSGKSNVSGSTSMGNSAIQNASGLAKCDNHNCRKYDNDRENIEVIRGSFSIVDDVKKLYIDEFEEAKLEYNNQQIREDRKIEDYFTHISNNSKKDLACEIIIELGDMEFWNSKDMDYKKKMTNVFKEQVNDLENVVPNFKIASAIIHYDETSPHLHIIGVPVKYKNKYGMSKQVGKSDVFTKESLTKIQDKMRVRCMESFNKEYQVNYQLKTKLKGRNRDYHITEMENYQKIKRSIEIHQSNLKSAKEKTEKLSNNISEIKEILEGLKAKGLIKNQLVIDVKDRDKAIVFIDLIDKTIAEYQNIQELSVTLKEISNELISNRQRLNLLTKNNESLNKEVDKLNKNIKEKENEIQELKEENYSLKSTLEHFKEMIYRLVQFLLDKIFVKKDKRYEEFAKDLYDYGALDKDNFNLLSNPNKLNNLKDYPKEKDDIDINF